MNAHSTLTETIEAALETALIMAHIEQAVTSGEITREDADEIKQAILRG